MTDSGSRENTGREIQQFLNCGSDLIVQGYI